MDETRIMCEITSQNRNTHSVNLMPMVEACLRFAGLALRDLDAVAAVTGPGSFTGVRIGVATARGLAHGVGLPCIAVDALEALARSAGSVDGRTIVCPMQDARAGQVYGAAFRAGQRLTPDQAVPLEEFLALLRPLGDRFLFLGDGMIAHRDAIRQQMGESGVLAPEAACYLRPSAAGEIALEKGQPVGYLSLQASYLRPPNAQKNRKLLEAMSHA